jgi:hypothetical protein
MLLYIHLEDEKSTHIDAYLMRKTCMGKNTINVGCCSVKDISPMKRTGLKLKLKTHLALVRTTVRELTPDQLKQVNGGGDLEYITYGCCADYTRS